MAIDLSKALKAASAPVVPGWGARPGSAPAGVAATIVQPLQSAPSASVPTGPAPTPPVDRLRERVAQTVYDGYCSAAARARLIDSAVNDLAMDQTLACIVVDLELEALFCANEQRLCDDLKGMLSRFSQSSQRLDPKEREDALQIVCRPKPGYTKGLSIDIAAQTVVAYCRANSVKIKVGLLRWEIP